MNTDITNTNKEKKHMKKLNKKHEQTIKVKDEDDLVHDIFSEALDAKKSSRSLLKQLSTLIYTIWELGLVLIPAMLSAYLLLKFKDIVVRGVGVAAGLYALWHLVENAYCVASSKIK